jgi:diaminopimelate decarboxylase
VKSKTNHKPADPAHFTPRFSFAREPGDAGRGCGATLHCEDVPVERIAQKCGTPVYVYSGAAIEASYRTFDRAFRRLPHTLCYAVKANSNLSLLALLARLGSGFDIVSGGELFRLCRAGISPQRVVFSGVGKTREEIREALRAGVLLLNVESEAELELLASEASRMRRVASAAIRVNPDVEAGAHKHIATGRHHHKFGVDWRVARRLYLAYKNSRHIRWQGISAHIGSQILSVEPYRRAVRRLANYYRELGRGGIALRLLDLGGGFAVRYFDEHPPSIKAYAQAILPEVRKLGCRLLLEPGRAIVGSAGILLTRVLYTKPSPQAGKHFVIVDAAMNDFIRPALYDAVHPVTYTGARPGGRRVTVDVVGPVCETGDCFLTDWPMELPRSGDLLALWGAGAYGSVAASNYNTRPRPAEVLVEGYRFRVIRRRETRSDLIRGE